jgi:hypothetical protein
MSLLFYVRNNANAIQFRDFFQRIYLALKVKGTESLLEWVLANKENNSDNVIKNTMFVFFCKR